MPFRRNSSPAESRVVYSSVVEQRDHAVAGGGARQDGGLFTIQSSGRFQGVRKHDNVLFICTSKNLRLGRKAASLHITHDPSAVKQSSSGMLDNTVRAIRNFPSSRFVTFF